MPPDTPHAVADAGLTDADFVAIKEAILTSYPELPELYGLLLDKWGVRVSNVIYTGQAGSLVIAALVDWAKGQGRTLEMLSLAWTEKHRQHHPLQKLAERFFPEPEAEVRRYAPDDVLFGGAPAIAVARRGFAKSAVPGSTLEARTLDPPPMIDFRLFSRLAEATCLVDVGNARATGFLIGRQTVLTVYHAVAEAITQGWPGERIKLSFGIGGEAGATTLDAAPGLAWRGPASSYSAADIDGKGASAPNELDFAAIRLVRPIEAGRAALALPREVPIVAPGDALLIAQHPAGGPLKLATGVLIGYSVEGERLHYEANTAPGSAGAPVLGQNNQLIAIHHAARMIGERRIAQGVPIWPIREAILAAGCRLEDL